MIEDLIKNNVISVSLEVNVENISAINLYKKFAFEKATIRKNYYGNKDAVLMIRKLIS
jgi:ribosomal protein S18 acetylase RimI-like enzyme